MEDQAGVHYDIQGQLVDNEPQASSWGVPWETRGNYSRMMGTPDNEEKPWIKATAPSVTGAATAKALPIAGAHSITMEQNIIAAQKSGLISEKTAHPPAAEVLGFGGSGLLGGQ